MIHLTLLVYIGSFGDFMGKPAFETAYDIEFALGVFRDINISFMRDTNEEIFRCRMDRVLILKFLMSPISKYS